MFFQFPHFYASIHFSYAEFIQEYKYDIYFAQIWILWEIFEYFEGAFVFNFYFHFYESEEKIVKLNILIIIDYDISKYWFSTCILFKIYRRFRIWRPFQKIMNISLDINVFLSIGITKKILFWFFYTPKFGLFHECFMNVSSKHYFFPWFSVNFFPHISLLCICSHK